MINKKNIISLVFFTVLLLPLVISSCKRDSVESRFENDLITKATNTDGFVWFNYSNISLPKSSGSGHEQPLLKTRYNSIAASVLDSVGRIKLNSIFPEGSIVVKELLGNDGKLQVYALLYKKSSHPNADAKGWVWAEYNSDASIKIASSLKGKDCIGCHSQAGNEDYMLMNKYFP